MGVKLVPAVGQQVSDRDLISCNYPIFTYPEAPVTRTTAMEFRRKFGEFQNKAQREPVEITCYGRRDLMLMSAEHYDWLTAAARRTYRTEDAASVAIEAVRCAEMDAEMAHLDELMK